MISLHATINIFYANFDNFFCCKKEFSGSSLRLSCNSSSISENNEVYTWGAGRKGQLGFLDSDKCLSKSEKPVKCKSNISHESSNLLLALFIRGWTVGGSNLFNIENKRKFKSENTTFASTWLIAQIKFCNVKLCTGL